MVGCEDRYGAYITIHARASDMAFDRLELYYGVARGTVVPTSPKYQRPEPADTNQLLVARAFAPDDVQSFTAQRTEYTVWIPEGGANDALGAYVLVIAYAGTEQVGMGELFDFVVPTDNIVYKYEVALAEVAVDELYEWGRGEATCLRVQRSRGANRPAVVAIVDPDDSDCDRFPDRSTSGTTDCEPLLYCDGSGQGDCLGKTPCLHGSDCRLGSCANADGASVTCAGETCVSDLFCEKCDLTRSPEEVLECALLEVMGHPQDLVLPLQGNQQLCDDPTILDLALPFPCTNPSVDAIAYFMPGTPFAFTIAEGPSPNQCRLRIQATIPNARFIALPHLLVTVELSPSSRTGFVIGLTGQEGACPPPGDPIGAPFVPNTGSCPTM